MVDLIGKYFAHSDIEIHHNNDMLQICQNDVSKALASFAMEQSLIRVGGPIVLSVVSDKIFEKYQGHIPDCYEHPEYLNTVLDDMSSSTRHMVVQLVKNQLEEFSYKKEIQNFLEKLNSGMCIAVA